MDTFNMSDGDVLEAVYEAARVSEMCCMCRKL